MVHGHVKARKAIALFSGLLYPVQMAFFFFVGLGLPN